METLVTVHSWTRWLVLAALIVGVVVGVQRYRSKTEWNPSLYQLAVMVVDIQVTIGIVIWIFDDGWSETVFYKVIHPVFMLLALGISHMGLAIAKKRNNVRSWAIASGGFVAALVLIIGAIPWDRL